MAASSNRDPLLNLLMMEKELFLAENASLSPVEQEQQWVARVTQLTNALISTTASLPTVSPSRVSNSHQYERSVNRAVVANYHLADDDPFSGFHMVPSVENEKTESYGQRNRGNVSQNSTASATTSGTCDSGYESLDFSPLIDGNSERSYESQYPLSTSEASGLAGPERLRFIGQAQQSQCNYPDQAAYLIHSTEALRPRTSGIIDVGNASPTAITTASGTGSGVAYPALGRSPPSEHRVVQQREADGAIQEVTSTAYACQQSIRIKCSQCNVEKDGFRGESELRRHTERAHAGVLRKVFICIDISTDAKFLGSCKACASNKRYNAFYNAAAHLRRVHFNPKEKAGKGKPEKSKIPGDWPPMHFVNWWMTEIEEMVSTGNIPDTNSGTDIGVENQSVTPSLFSFGPKTFSALEGVLARLEEGRMSGLPGTLEPPTTRAMLQDHTISTKDHSHSEVSSWQTAESNMADIPNTAESVEIPLQRGEPAMDRTKELVMYQDTRSGQAAPALGLEWSPHEARNARLVENSKQPVAEEVPMEEVFPKANQGACNQRCDSASLTNERSISNFSPSSGSPGNDQSSSDDTDTSDSLLDADTSILYAKHKLVANLMREVYTIFESGSTANLRSYAGSQSKQSPRGKQREDSPSRKTGKRRMRRSESLPPSDDEENGRKRQHTDLHDAKPSPLFACPFNKYDSDKYRSNASNCAKYRTCAGPGLPSISRLRQHLRRTHAAPIQCQRCWVTMPDLQYMARHLNEDTRCEKTESPLPEGIDQDKMRLITSSYGASWSQIYKILFPGAPIPSPYYEPLISSPPQGMVLAPSPASQEIAEFEAYSRRALPALVEANLQAIVNTEMAPFEESLTTLLVDIVRRCLSTVSQNFQRLQGSRASGNGSPELSSVQGRSTQHSEFESTATGPAHRHYQEPPFQPTDLSTSTWAPPMGSPAQGENPQATVSDSGYWSATNYNACACHCHMFDDPLNSSPSSDSCQGCTLNHTNFDFDSFLENDKHGDRV